VLSEKKESFMIIYRSSVYVLVFKWYLSYSRYTYIYVMNDKLDKLFANIHNNEKAIGLIFYYWSMEMIRDLISSRTLTKNIYMWMYINLHTYGRDRSSGLHHTIVIHFFFIYINRYEQFNVVIYSDKKKNIMIFYFFFFFI
jgi:hypothetical protein